MNNQKNDIQVSVCVVTYNQEAYIAECLDSLVSQKTDFKFEIIVGEDCSTDNTREIIKQYAEKYPHLIVPLFYEKNVGAVENVKRVYKKAQGKYIAHMDGDDMGLPGKLQKQFDIMEKNPQAIICSHNMLEILDDNILKKTYWNYPKGEYTILDLIRKLPFFAHSSKMFRVTDNKELYYILDNPHVLDIELHVYQASKGSIMHLEGNLGCYRKNVGISADKNNELNYNSMRRVHALYENLLIKYPEMKREIKRSYASSLLSDAYRSAVFESDGKKMKEYTISSVKHDFFSTKQFLMILLSFSPKVGSAAIRYRYKLKSIKKNI